MKVKCVANEFHVIFVLEYCVCFVASSRESSNKEHFVSGNLSYSYRSDHQRLADIFVQKGPYLKMYSTYIREFDRNVALLDEQCRKNPPFASVVRQFEVGVCVRPSL